MIQYNKKI